MQRLSLPRHSSSCSVRIGTALPRQTPPRYPGKLDDPLPVSEDDLPEIHDRLMLLFDFYGVERPGEPGDNDICSWRDLALSLTVRHVPGLRSSKPPGSRRKWGGWQLVRLYLDVTILARKHSYGVSRTCERLAGEDPWKSFIRPKASRKSRGQTLRRKFYSIKKQNHRIVGIVERTIRDFPDDADDRLRLARERIQV